MDPIEVVEYTEMRFADGTLVFRVTGHLKFEKDEIIKLHDDTFKVIQGPNKRMVNSNTSLRVTHVYYMKQAV